MVLVLRRWFVGKVLTSMKTLVWIPSTHVKPDRIACICNAGSPIVKWMQGQENPQKITHQLFQHVQQGTARRFCLKRVRKEGADTWDCLLTSNAQVATSQKYICTSDRQTNRQTDSHTHRGRGGKIFFEIVKLSTLHFECIALYFVFEYTHIVSVSDRPFEHKDSWGLSKCKGLNQNLCLAWWFNASVRGDV